MRRQARCDLDGHGRRRLVSRVTLVSFDIDGTLEVGEPPGIVPIALVRDAKRLGYVVGSCCYLPVSFQQNLWERLRIAVDFTVLKHRLPDVRAQFTAAAYYHIGDTEVDAFYPNAAAFSFLRPGAETRRLGPPDLFVPPLDGRRA